MAEWTEVQQRDCKALFNAGSSYTVIAAQVGHSRSAVAGWLQRKKIFRRAGPPLRPKSVRHPPTPRPVTVRSYKEPSEQPPPPPLLNTGCDIQRTIVPLIYLAKDGCKWPVVFRGFHLLCNCRRKFGSPYCASHTALAFAPPRGPSSRTRLFREWRNRR